LVDDGVAGERVTPTGASILRYLNCAQRSDGQVRKLMRTGIGFGTRWMPGLSNVLRVLVFEASAMEFATDQVAQIEFEIDDQSPEDLAIALDRLRAHAGVLDVLQISASGKKGRMSAHIQVLVQPASVHEVGEMCFRETTTIGFRQQMLSRRTLARRSEVVHVEGHDLRAKLVERPGVVTVKIESDDLAAVSGERKQREQVRREAEAIALKRTL
jgi:uncharacterized protein (DUF111 family)